jgi:hypothetical protein
MSFTVVPLHNLKLAPGTRIPFANGLVLQDLPNWVREEKFLDYLSFRDRQSVLRDDHALVAEYDASAIGEPDPSWRGKTPKSVQDAKAHWAMIASLAIWLRQPSNVCFTVVLHSVSSTIPGRAEKQQIIQQSETQTPIYCHPKDAGNVVTTDHLVKAAELHPVLCSIPNDNAVWVAMRTLWAGLTSYSADIRYSLFWVALEALFGADDNSGEISYKLAQRIAFFLADTPADARDLFAKAKKCYGIRSKIVHGRWKSEPDIDEGMAQTEAILRTAFRHLIDSPELLRTFVSKKRDKYLEDWVFSRATEPPPFQN